MTRKNRTKSSEGPHAASHAAGRGWPLDVRVKLARAVVEQRVSTRAVASQLGVPYTTAVEWVQRYRRGGAAALQPAERRGRAKPAASVNARDAAILATQAAQPHAGTRRIRDVMRRFLGVGASATTVRRVLREHGALAPPGPRRRSGSASWRASSAPSRTSCGSRICSRFCCAGTSACTSPRSWMITPAIS